MVPGAPDGTEHVEIVLQLNMQPYIEGGIKNPDYDNMSIYNEYSLDIGAIEIVPEIIKPQTMG